MAVSRQRSRNTGPRQKSRRRFSTDHLHQFGHKRDRTLILGLRLDWGSGRLPRWDVVIDPQAPSSLLDALPRNGALQISVVAGVAEGVKAVDAGQTVHHGAVLDDLEGRGHDLCESFVMLIEMTGPAGHRIPQQRIHSGSATSVQVGSTSWAGSSGRFSACPFALRRSRQYLICTNKAHLSVATNTCTFVRAHARPRGATSHCRRCRPESVPPCRPLRR